MTGVDTRRERAALLALLRDRRSGWGVVADRVEEVGSAVEVLQAELVSGQGDLFAPEPENDLGLRITAVNEAMDGWAADGIALVTLLDEDYPAQLRTIHQRPPFLFYRGSLNEADARGVAIVGTRNASDDGLARASKIAARLAMKGVTVISGLADGIDSAAHRAALSAGGRTVALIGTGVLRSYPAKNAHLQELLATEHLVLSQFWPDSPPTRHSFPMRNAVMSGYAAATVVVEATARSGAKMQARLALEHGRPVFLLDTLLDHPWAREYAARPGTTVVGSPEEVLDALEEVLAPVDELVLT